MSQNETVQKTLTARQEQAALLVALGQLTEAEIAQRTGTKFGTLKRWKAWPEFAGRVEALRAAFARSVEARGIADRQARVQKLQDLLDRMTAIVEGRAADMASVPGGASGLLVRQYKQTGKDSYEVEYAFDAALPREMRATMQQAAQELGQWTTKSELKVSDLDAAIERELAKLAAGAEGATAGAVAGADGEEAE